MTNHVKAAEQALRAAEERYGTLRHGEVDFAQEQVALRDVHYDLSFANAHIAIAQAQGYGQAIGAVGRMADKITADTPAADVGTTE